LKTSYIFNFIQTSLLFMFWPFLILLCIYEVDLSIITSINKLISWQKIIKNQLFYHCQVVTKFIKYYAMFNLLCCSLTLKVTKKTKFFRKKTIFQLNRIYWSNNIDKKKYSFRNTVEFISFMSFMSFLFHTTLKRITLFVTILTKL